MSLNIGISRDRDVQRIADVIESFKERPTPEGLGELGQLLPSRELRFFVGLPQYEVRTLEGLHINSLRDLAGGGSTLVVNGISELLQVTRDNLGDACINGRPELFFRKGEIYGLEPPVRRVGFGIVVPIGVITGVAIGLRDKTSFPNT